MSFVFGIALLFLNVFEFSKKEADQNELICGIPWIHLVPHKEYNLSDRQKDSPTINVSHGSLSHQYGCYANKEVVKVYLPENSLFVESKSQCNFLVGPTVHQRRSSFIPF